MYINDDPIVASDFYGPGTFIRSGLNTRLYCGSCGAACYHEVHADGEVLMGALWKVRKCLNDSTAMPPATRSPTSCSWAG